MQHHLEGAFSVINQQSLVSKLIQMMKFSPSLHTHTKHCSDVFPRGVVQMLIGSERQTFEIQIDIETVGIITLANK